MAIAIDNSGTDLDMIGINGLTDSVVVFGKRIDAIQEDLLVLKATGTITGKLKAVTGWTQFSDVTEYQSGHFLCFRVFPRQNDPDRMTVGMVKTDGTKNIVTLDSMYQNIVFRVADKDTEKIVITAFKGSQYSQVVFDLSGLVLL